MKDKQTEALKLALEFLEQGDFVYPTDLATAIREALAEQPAQQQEPMAITAEQAHEIGAKGATPTEEERLLFEAWMRGHCWAVVGEWDGKTYKHEAETNGWPHPGAMLTRQLWAAWRDRAALTSPPAQRKPLTDERHYKQIIDAVREVFDAKRKQQPAQHEPVAWLRKSDLNELRKCNYMRLGADSPSIWAPNAPDKPSPDMGLVAVYTASQPAQQEPVAWIRWEWNRSGLRSLTFTKPAELPLAEEATGVVYDPLYTSPPASKPWVGLTGEEIEKAWTDMCGPQSWARHAVYARSIEARLKEKNT